MNIQVQLWQFDSSHIIYFLFTDQTFSSMENSHVRDKPYLDEAMAVSDIVRHMKCLFLVILSKSAMDQHTATVSI